jgi:hypothetical protein
MKTDEDKNAERDRIRAAVLIAECGYCGAVGLKPWELYPHVVACSQIANPPTPTWGFPPPPVKEGPYRVRCAICEGKPRMPWHVSCTACGGTGWYTL